MGHQLVFSWIYPGFPGFILDSLDLSWIPWICSEMFPEIHKDIHEAWDSIYGEKTVFFSIVWEGLAWVSMG